LEEYYYYLYIYIIRLASNEIFSPSNKIHREVGRVKDYDTEGRISGDEELKKRFGRRTR